MVYIFGFYEQNIPSSMNTLAKGTSNILFRTLEVTLF